MNQAERNQMIEENLPLVGYLVRDQLATAFGFSADDLAQAGALALVKAVDAYDPSRGVPFGAFARERILGGIKDEMRTHDWAKRTTRTQIKTTLAQQEALETTLGRTATVAEVADAMGVDRRTVEESLEYANRVTVSLTPEASEYLAAGDTLPETELLVQERLGYLNAAIAALPERMRFIIEAIYLHERTVGDVADELGVTHSAVSQQRAEAVRLLRQGLAAHYSDTDAPAAELAPATGKAATFLKTFADRLAQGPVSLVSAAA